MKINRTILDLNTVYCNLTHADTIEVLDDLKASKQELEDILNALRAENADCYDEMNAIEEQLTYLRRNIRTVEDALLCHESKITERFKLRDTTAVIFLN